MFPQTTHSQLWPPMHLHLGSHAPQAPRQALASSVQICTHSMELAPVPGMTGFCSWRCKEACAAGSTATESILPAGGSSASGCIQSDARHQSAPTTAGGAVSGHGGSSSGVVSGVAQWHLVPKALLTQIKLKMTAIHCHDHECSECKSAHCNLLMCSRCMAGWAAVNMHQHSMQNDACTFLGCTVWLCLQKSLHS